MFRFPVRCASTKCVFFGDNGLPRGYILKGTKHVSQYFRIVRLWCKHHGITQVYDYSMRPLTWRHHIGDMYAKFCGGMKIQNLSEICILDSVWCPSHLLVCYFLLTYLHSCLLICLLFQWLASYVVSYFLAHLLPSLTKHGFLMVRGWHFENISFVSGWRSALMDGTMVSHAERCLACISLFVDKIRLFSCFIRPIDLWTSLFHV